MPDEHVITPQTVEWTLVAKSADRKGQSRVFYQSELSMDGEVAILGLAARAMAILAENKFPFSKLETLQQDDGQLNVESAAALASEFAPYLPGLASESSAIMFGYYPTDDFGRRLPDYDEAVAFIRASLTMVRWIEILNVFTDQNDWRRMTAPFAGALQRGLTLGIVAERIQKEAEEQSKAATSTSRGSSTNSSRRATARRTTSGGTSPNVSSSTT